MDGVVLSAEKVMGLICPCVRDCQFLGSVNQAEMVCITMELEQRSFVFLASTMKSPSYRVQAFQQQRSVWLAG